MQMLCAAICPVVELKAMQTRLSGEIKPDELYFSGRGAAGTSIVVGLLERGGSFPNFMDTWLRSISSQEGCHGSTTEVFGPV